LVIGAVVSGSAVAVPGSPAVFVGVAGVVPRVTVIVTIGGRSGCSGA
jgi:hypothetical protein